MNINENKNNFFNKGMELDQLFTSITNEEDQANHQNSTLVKEKNKEYQEKIDQFKSLNDLEKFEQEKLNEKQEQLKDLKEAIKKNRQDHTYKINALERDYQAKVKEIENEIKELKKSYKSKLIESKRKLEYEIKRINDLTKRRSSPLDKELLVVNEPIHIKTISNEIKKIRKESYEQIYLLNKEHLDELKALELEHKQNILTKEIDLKIYREELNIKISELKEKIDLLTIDDEINSKAYDFNLHEELVNKEKINLLSLNEYEREFSLQLASLQQELLENLYQLNLKKHEVLTKYQEIIAGHLDSEISELLIKKENLYQMFISKFDFIEQIINNLIETFEQTINEQITDVIKNLIITNDEFLNDSIINSSNTYQWQTFDYQFNYLLFKEQIVNFKEEENKRLNKYLKELASQIKTLNQVLRDILNNFIQFVETEINQDRKLMRDYLSHHEQVQENAKVVFENKQTNLISRYQQELNEINKRIDKINLDYEHKKQVITEMYNNNIIEHQNTMKSFDAIIKANQQEIINHTKQEILNAKQNINQIKEEKKQMLREITKEVITKYQEKYEKILQEKKEQIKLL